MILSRTVGVETLDTLQEDDPAARQSRRDLKRVHRAMGTRSILRRALLSMMAGRRDPAPLRVLELGAGDGSLMLGVARALGAQFPNVELTLLDAQSLVDRAMVQRFAGTGWAVRSSVADALVWANGDTDFLQRRNGPSRWDLVIVNLFLHHFSEARLRALLTAIAVRSDRFLACEPRRAWLPLVASHLVGAIGANAVTRQDAVLSVKAGFQSGELTALWPQRGIEWQTDEYSAGLFSHCFRAERAGLK